MQAARLSIVVLPFTNLSYDPAQDYFADGVTENLTTELSRIRNSFVIARNTAFTLQGQEPSTPRPSVRNWACAMSSKARCSATPTECASTLSLLTRETGAGNFWADRFDEDVADLFKLQDEVVARLARTLQIELVNAEAQRSLHDRPRNPDAIDLTMRGLALLNQPMTKASTYEARDLFEQALTLDSANADALAGAACRRRV